MPNHVVQNAAPVPAEHLQAIGELLACYGSSRTSTPRLIDEGVLNENYRVETPDGPRFVRRHRVTTTNESLGLEHHVIRWVGERGIPVTLPLATPDAATFRELDGRFWAVFPWLEPRHFQRGTIDVNGVAQFGEMLGQLDATLATFDDERLPGNSRIRWKTEQVLAELKHIQFLVRDDPTLGEHAVVVRDAIACQIALLESGAARPDSDFESLPVQPVHGDYHFGNVMLDARGQIVAVVDWERVGLQSTMYHLLRCLSFCYLLETPFLEAFMAGYRRHNPISAEEAELGVALWWQSRLHSTWVYRTRFIEHDRRVDRFLANPEGATMNWFSTPAARADLAKRLRE